MIPWYAWFIPLYLATWLAIPNVLLSTKRPPSMVAWIGAIILLPFLGPGLYLAFGTDRLHRRRLKRHLRKSSRASAPAPSAPGSAGAGEAIDLTKRETVLLRAVSQISGAAATHIDTLELLGDAQAYYESLDGHCRRARHHIHFQTYVWRDDDTGRKMLAALVAAARRGVQVRLLVDELGSVETPESFFRPLIEAGGEFSWFYTIHPRRNRYFLNLRNHRKLQLVDGTHAYVGGMNIGREYEGRDPAVGAWRDLQVRLTGGVVHDLQEGFANDWYFATRRKYSGQDYFPAPAQPGTTPALLVESGPDSDRKPFLKALITLCNFAEESLDLFTPYFVPVPAMIYAFQLAAARGVRVRLMVSEKNDHRFLVKIGRSYYEELMTHGVEIYEYSEAVHHTKAVVVDRRWLLVGSANLDVRSIDLNFELNVLLRSPETCTRLDKIHSPMFAVSAQLKLEEFRQRPRRERLSEGLSRLWAPLL